MSRTGNTAWKALILAHDTPYPDTLDYGEPSDVESLEEGECDANEQDSECHHVGKSLLLRISDHRRHTFLPPICSLTCVCPGVEDTYQDGRDDDGWEPQSIRGEIISVLSCICVINLACLITDSGSRLPLVAYNHQVCCLPSKFRQVPPRLLF